MNLLLNPCRRHLLFAALFSLVINLLQLTVPLYMLQVFDRVLSSRSHDTLLALSMLAAGAVAVHLLLDLLRSRLLLAAGLTLDGLAGPAALSRLLAGAAHSPQGAMGAELKDVSTLRGFLTGPGIVALFDAPWLPVYLGVIFLFHAQLGAIASTGAVLLLLLAVLNERCTRQPTLDTQRAARAAATAIDDAMRHAEVVNVLGMAGAVQRRWQHGNRSTVDAHVRAVSRSNLLTALTRCVRLLVQIVMLAAGAMLVIDHQASAGVMTAATLILARALAPAEAAMGTWRACIEARAAWCRLQSLWAATAEAAPSTRLPAPRGRLVAERVTVVPQGAEAALLHHVSFALEPGESLGVIGPSGSGKSTLARVLAGGLPPNGGVVRLDGADLRDWPHANLGPHLGYLPQDVQLLRGTVAQNIARLDEAADDAVIAAATIAQAHRMILQLPGGYDTPVGEGGILLSGGQCRRIGLARALFGKPRLVVLDEPDAGLDRAGEQALLRALCDLKGCGATVIVVSHRPSLLAQVDKLLVLDGGRATHFGPHAEVMQRLTARAEPGPHPVPHLVVGAAA